MYLLYGLIVWGSTVPTYLKKLTTLQNKAIKFIGQAKFSERATPYYYRFEILNFVQGIKFP